MGWKFNSKMKKQMIELLEAGNSKAGACRKLKITRATLYKNMKQDQEFAEAVETATFSIIYDVEDKLYKRARGYKYMETKKVKDVQGRIVREEKTVKEVPPDVGAMAFILKNRHPTKWRDRRDLEVTGKMEVEQKPDLSKLSTEELKDLEKILKKAETSETG